MYMPRKDGKKYYSTDFTEKDICRWKKHRIYAIMDGDDGQGDPPSAGYLSESLPIKGSAV